MIKGVSGVPGSGKTYFVVKEIAEKYFTFDKQYSEWTHNKDYPELTIFTNIKEFKLPCVNVDQYLKQNNIDFETFLTVPYFEKLVEQNPKMKYLILLDEAQKYFPSNYKNNDVLFLFQYHRHLGIDFYLTYQSWGSITRKITDLLEFEIRAVRSSFKIMNEFRYHFYVGGFDKIGGTVKKTDKMIFALYKSFDVKSLEKPPHPARKLLLVCVLLVLAFFGGFRYFVHNFNLGKNTRITQNVASGIESPRIPIDQKARKQGGGLRDRPPAAAKPSMPLPDIDPTTRVLLGGMWFGDRLVAIEFFGKVIALRDFTYSYTADIENHRVVAAIPDDILAQLNTLQTGGFMRNRTDDGTYSKIGQKYETTEPETGRATHFVDDGKTGNLPKKNQPSS